MSRSRRRGIERGRDADHEIVEEDATPASFERFYRAYERVMARVGADPFPLAFFEELLPMKSRILLVTCRVEGNYAGGFLELLDEEQSSVHGFISAVPEEYFEYNVPELLYDHVIRWSIDHGYETYDLGSTSPDFEDGLFRFKASFGGQVLPTLVWERGQSPLWPVVKKGRTKYLKYSR